MMRATHAPAPFRRRQVGCERDHHLAGHRGGAHGEGGEGEEPQARGERRGDEGDRIEAEEPHDERAARVEVAERDDEEQPRRVPDLGRRDHPRGLARTAVEALGDAVQQRLGVVEVRHDGPRGHGDEGNERP